METAFSDFVELVKDIPTLRAVGVPSSASYEITTFIDELDDDVFGRIAHAENELLLRHLDIEIEFHTICLKGSKPTDHDLGTLNCVLPTHGE